MDKHGTNLAEVGTDVPDINVGELISRQAAIDALENDKAALDKIIKGMSAEDMLLKYYVAQHNQVSYDIDAITQLPAAHEPLTDKEQRIFLAAMGRERKVCKEVDDQYTHEPYEVMLTKVCSEIERKVKAVLWI